MEAFRFHYSVRLMCRALELAPSGYYAWRKRRLDDCKASEERRLVAEIREIHDMSRRTYGSPRVTAELHARDKIINRKRVERLMRLHGICGRVRRKYRRTTDSRHSHPIAANTLDRQFDVPLPNKVWVADITYISTREGWLYLAVVLDLFSRRIVGWSMADHMETSLVSSALEMALGMRDCGGDLLHHSDRGVQYASHKYQSLLQENGIQVSMSRKGSCHDNAVAESFFGTLKQELVYACSFATRASARVAIEDYIEVFYNRIRRHSTLGYLSPAEFEALFLAANAA